MTTNIALAAWKWGQHVSPWTFIFFIYLFPPSWALLVRGVLGRLLSDWCLEWGGDKIMAARGRISSISSPPSDSESMGPPAPHKYINRMERVAQREWAYKAMGPDPYNSYTLDKWRQIMVGRQAEERACSWGRGWGRGEGWWGQRGTSLSIRNRL